jgi:hypothetical protein
MEEYIYPLSLLVVALLAFVFYRNNAHIMMLIVIAIGAYIVYSHETGYSSESLKQQIVETIDESIKD